MAREKTVRDVMVGIFEYPHIPYWFSINQAMRIVKVSFLQSKKYLEPMAILVFDEKYNFLGTLTFKDILKGLDPRVKGQTAESRAGTEEQPESADTWNSLFDEGSKGLAEKPVSDIMVAAKFFVEPNDSLTKAAYLMLRHDLVLLPVLEEKKKFVGLVRMMEIFDEISNMLLNERKE